MGVDIGTAHRLPVIGIKQTTHSGIGAIERAAQHHHARVLPQKLPQPLADAGVVLRVVGVAQGEVAGIGNAQIVKADAVLQVVGFVVAAQLVPNGAGRTGPAAFQHGTKIEGQAHEAHVGFGQLGGGTDEVAEKSKLGTKSSRAVV